MSTLQRSASSVVEPGLRLSRTSRNSVPPVLLPYSHRLTPSYVLQSWESHWLAAAFVNAWV